MKVSFKIIIYSLWYNHVTKYIWKKGKFHDIFFYTNCKAVKKNNIESENPDESGWGILEILWKD